MSVTLQVVIPDELVPALEMRARAAGMRREEYASALLAREMETSLDVVLAGFRREVEAVGLPDEALTQLFEEARAEVQPGKKS